MSPPRRRRVGRASVEWLRQTLSTRDWAIVHAVSIVRLASGDQLERLHFADLSGRSRQVMRWRVLKRLVDVQALVTLPRRIGAAPRGSAKLCFALGAAGHHLAQRRPNHGRAHPRSYRRGVPGERFVEHTLAVTELYVALIELGRRSDGGLVSFHAESAAWWPDGLRGWLKPDAFVALHGSGHTDYWWCEVDLATESLPTVRRKLLRYLDFVNRGQLGPDGVMPQVLVLPLATPRRDAIQAVVAGLPPPAAALVRVVNLQEAADFTFQELRN